LPPLPKNEPVRRNSRVGPVVLPAEGRKGIAPEWPIPGTISREERHAWTELWETPQAVAWEKLGWTRTVARYCRMMIEAEQPNAKATLLAQVSVLEDRLGLTPKAMRALMWTVASDEVADKRAEPVSGGVRGRIKAVG
jgi:hypothetical protein